MNELRRGGHVFFKSCTYIPYLTKSCNFPTEISLNEFISAEVPAIKSLFFGNLLIPFVFKTVHRGAFCQFPFLWIYCYGSNKSTRKETGKMHLCAVFAQSVFDTKNWYFHQTFQLMSAVVRLKGLVKVPLFCVKQR